MVAGSDLVAQDRTPFLLSIIYSLFLNSNNSPPTKASNLRPTPPLWEEDLHSGQRVLYNPLGTNERHVDPRSLYRTVRPQALIFIEPFQHSFTFRFLGNVDPRLGSSTGNLQHSTGSSTGNLQHGSARRFVRVVAGGFERRRRADRFTLDGAAPP